jgi:drug/metabolite transporter (DMT)-like permease
VQPFFFGASVPFAKLLAEQLSPILLAGLLYAGSGVGLIILRLIKDRGWRHSGIENRDLIWLIGAIAFGGVIGPILLMFGLQRTNASTASLLLNFEAVFTALLAWIVFKESTALRIVFGMFLIISGGIVLSWSQSEKMTQGLFGSIAILGACLCWAIDNNFTRKVSGGDPLFIAGSKGLISGAISTCLALYFGMSFPLWVTVSYALLLGFIGYGASLVLFVIALRGLGTARTGAYFSTAPFIGSAIAIFFFHEPTSALFWIASLLMGIGVWLHLTEHHKHEHIHELLNHVHSHIHDEHHQHSHDFPSEDEAAHTHYHKHSAIKHSHPHYPDIHHRHKHK